MLALIHIHIQWIAGIIFIILYCVTILGLVLVIITENRNPLKTIPWVIVLLLAPGIGLLFYFIFGQDNRKQRIISRRTYKRIMKRPQAGKLPQDTCSVPAPYQPLVTLLTNSNQSSLLYGSDITIYTNGTDKFHDLLEEIAQATHHIHIQYYIFCDDEIGNKVKELLIGKAKEGVEVRVLYDDVGCWNVKDKFFKEMSDAGIEVHAFLKVAFPVFTSKVNYRNHRKIVVIDGKVGFMGGMNIADRYTKGTSWGTWRDTHFKIIGKGVHGLQAAFLIDWYVVSKKLLNEKIYYPPLPVYSDDNIMQICTSGPVGQWRTLLQAAIFTVANAKKYVFIQTPYFLPTDALQHALEAASLSKIDVRIMIPRKSDSRLLQFASFSYVTKCLRAGMKVYLYNPGMLHAKGMIIDDNLVTAGSTNFDFRSFENNFESNLFIYDKEVNRKMRDIFFSDMRSCSKVTYSAWIKRPLPQRFMESTIRLFSPIL